MTDPSEAMMRQRARDAQDAAQRWLDLERAYENALSERDSLASRVASYEQTHVMMQDELARLRAENKELGLQNQDMLSRVRDAARCIVGIVHQGDGPEKFAPNPDGARLSHVIDPPTQTLEDVEGAEAMGQMFRPRI